MDIRGRLLRISGWSCCEGSSRAAGYPRRFRRRRTRQGGDRRIGCRLLVNRRCQLRDGSLDNRMGAEMDLSFSFVTHGRRGGGCRGGSRRRRGGGSACRMRRSGCARARGRDDDGRHALRGCQGRRWHRRCRLCFLDRRRRLWDILRRRQSWSGRRGSRRSWSGRRESRCFRNRAGNQRERHRDNRDAVGRFHLVLLSLRSSGYFSRKRNGGCGSSRGSEAGGEGVRHGGRVGGFFVLAGWLGDRALRTVGVGHASGNLDHVRGERGDERGEREEGHDDRVRGARQPAMQLDHSTQRPPARPGVGTVAHDFLKYARCIWRRRLQTSSSAAS